MIDTTRLHDNLMFQGVPTDVIDEITRPLPRIELAAGETLFNEGDPGDALYFILSGMIEVFSRREGRDITIRTFMPGAYFGELALLGQETRSASARALEPTALLAMDRAALERAVQRHVPIAANIGRVLASQLVATTRSAIHVERGELVLLVVGELRRQGAVARYLMDAMAALTPGGAASLGPRSLFPQAPYIAAAIREHVRPDTTDATGLCPFSYRGGALVEATSRADAIRIMTDYFRRWWKRTVIVVGEEERAWFNLALSAVDRVVIVGTVDEIVSWSQPDLLASGVPLEVAPLLANDESRREAASALHRAGFATPLIWLPDAATLAAAVEPGFQRRDLTNLALEHQRTLLRLARALSRTRIGVALGAGGARGMAHIGAVRVLEELGVPIDAITGTSIGSMVGGVFATGRSSADAEEYLHFWMRTGLRKLIRPAFSRQGILSAGVIEDTCDDLFGERRFIDLQTPLGVVAADLVTGRCVALRGGRVARAVHASMSIPGMFPTVRLGEYCLVDGGVCDPVPADVLPEIGADIRIAVNISFTPEDVARWAREEGAAPPERTERAGQSPSLVEAYMAAFSMAVSARAATTETQADVYVRPRFLVTSWREFSQAPEHLRRGYDAAQRAEPQLREAIPWLG